MSDSQYHIPFADLLTMTIDAIVIVNQLGEISFFNQGAERLFGYTAAEVTGQPLTILLPPQVAQVHRQHMQTLASAPDFARSMETHNDLTGRRKDGREFNIEASICKLTHNQQIFFAAILRDISDRRHLEDQILEMNAKLEQLVTERTAELEHNTRRAEALVRIASRLNAQRDLNTLIRAVCEETALALNVPIAVMTLYDEQQDALVFGEGYGLEPEWIAQIKPVPCSLLGNETEQTSTVGVFEDVQQETWLPNAPLYQRIQARTMACARVIREETLIGLLTVLTLGETRSFSHNDLLLMQGVAYQAAQALANVRLLADLQQERTMLSQRVTERTAALSAVNTQLSRAARLKDEFLANMSHELRTPLNAILGQTEILQDQLFGLLNAKQLKSTRQIAESGQHLLSLINDILDLAKIESGNIELFFEELSVTNICQTSLQFIKQMAQKKAIHIHVADIPPNTLLIADGRRLKQILVNLLNNAVKFTPSGGTVGMEVDLMPPFIDFCVWDTGIGMPSDQIEQLFRPFVQLNSTLAREHEGTGLGLALVKTLVEMHSGHISVESMVGKGSRFTVSLPWRTPDRMSPSLVDLDYHRLNAPDLLSLHRALIITSSSSTSDQLIHYLNKFQMQTVTHPTGKVAVDIARQIQPQLIFLDSYLPDISGEHLLRHLKSHAETSAIPVVMVSATEATDRFRQAGSITALMKPISPYALWDALTQVATYLSQLEERHRDTAQTEEESSLPLILLTEDNEASITILLDYLHAQHYRVILASNGIEAIELAQQEQPDLILMDVQLPRMDGIEAIRHIRADTHTANIPIIVITALAMPGDRERCLASGANDYLSKPFSLKQLLQLIKRHMPQHVIS